MPLRFASTLPLLVVLVSCVHNAPRPSPLTSRSPTIEPLESTLAVPIVLQLPSVASEIQKLGVAEVHLLATRFSKPTPDQVEITLDFAYHLHLEFHCHEWFLWWKICDFDTVSDRDLPFSITATTNLGLTQDWLLSPSTSVSFACPDPGIQAWIRTNLAPSFARIANQVDTAIGVQLLRERAVAATKELTAPIVVRNGDFEAYLDPAWRTAFITPLDVTPKGDLVAYVGLLGATELRLGKAPSGSPSAPALTYETRPMAPNRFAVRTRAAMSLDDLNQLRPLLHEQLLDSERGIYLEDLVRVESEANYLKLQIRLRGGGMSGTYWVVGVPRVDSTKTLWVDGLNFDANSLAVLPNLANFPFHDIALKFLSDKARWSLAPHLDQSVDAIAPAFREYFHNQVNLKRIQVVPQDVLTQSGGVVAIVDIIADIDYNL